MSPRGHPTFDQLDRFLENRLADEEHRTVLRHLLTRCAACCSYVEEEVYPGSRPSYEAAFAGIPRRVARATEDRSMERLLATSLWAALEGRPPAQRLRMVVQDAHFHERSLVERLIEVSRDHHLCDPQGARELAELGLAVADRLDARALPEGFAVDSRTAALANLGDAWRRCEDLPAAERSFAAAWQSLERGSGDPRARADLMRHEASLRLAQGDLEGCLRRLRSAAAIYRHHHEPQEQGRAVLQMAQASGHREPARR